MSLIAFLPDLVRRAEALAASEDRVILGITGPPGAGKSTLADLLHSRPDASAGHLPMDGFHLADVSRRQLRLIRQVNSARSVPTDTLTL